MEMKSPRLPRLRGDHSPEYLEGYEASDRGITRMRNPYAMDVLTEEGRIKYTDWEDGWMAKFYGEAL